MLISHKWQHWPSSALKYFRINHMKELTLKFILWERTSSCYNIICIIRLGKLLLLPDCLLLRFEGFCRLWLRTKRDSEVQSNIFKRRNKLFKRWLPKSELFSSLEILFVSSSNSNVNSLRDKRTMTLLILWYRTCETSRLNQQKPRVPEFTVVNFI